MSRMSTKRLAEILKPLNPCPYGLRHLRQHKTVQGWWNNPKTPIGHRCYIWLLICVADTDNIFAEEFDAFFKEYGRIYDRYLLNDINKQRVLFANQFTYYPLCCYGSHFYLSDKATKVFFNTFRCPTDKELNLGDQVIPRERNKLKNLPKFGIMGD